MKFVLAKCPSCNGDLQIPDDKDFITCMYCASSIKVRDAIKISIDNNIPNLIKLIEDAIKNQNYPEAYDYCNRVLEHDITNYLVRYYKGTVISKLVDKKNLRILEIKSCFENALNNCKEDKINELKLSIKETLYAISLHLFKLNENSIKVIEHGETKVDKFFDNNRKIIQLLKLIPEKLKIEENKVYEVIIALCKKMISDRIYFYHTSVGAQNAKTNRIFISDKIKKEFNDVIADCQKSLRVLNPEEYAKREAKLIASKKKEIRIVIILALIILSVFLAIYIYYLLNDDNSKNNIKNKNGIGKLNTFPSLPSIAWGKAFSCNF